MQSVAGVPRRDGDDGISWWRYWPHPDGDADGGDNEGAAAERGGGRREPSRLKPAADRRRGITEASGSEQTSRNQEKPTTASQLLCPPGVSSLYRPDETVGPTL